MPRGDGHDDVTAPDGIDVPIWVKNDTQRRAVMSEIVTFGLDLAKNVLRVHGADGAGRATRTGIGRRRVCFWQVLD